MTLKEALAELGLDQVEDRVTVRRAYLRRLKTRRPERDPAGFQRLREAYERVSRLAGDEASAVSTEGDPRADLPEDESPAISLETELSPGAETEERRAGSADHWLPPSEAELLDLGDDIPLFALSADGGDEAWIERLQACQALLDDDPHDALEDRALALLAHSREAEPLGAGQVLRLTEILQSTSLALYARRQPATAAALSRALDRFLDDSGSRLILTRAAPVAEMDIWLQELAAVSERVPEELLAILAEHLAHRDRDGLMDALKAFRKASRRRARLAAKAMSSSTFFRATVVPLLRGRKPQRRSAHSEAEARGRFRRWLRAIGVYVALIVVVQLLIAAITALPIFQEATARESNLGQAEEAVRMSCGLQDSGPLTQICEEAAALTALLQEERCRPALGALRSLKEETETLADTPQHLRATGIRIALVEAYRETCADGPGRAPDLTAAEKVFSLACRPSHQQGEAPYCHPARRALGSLRSDDCAAAELALGELEELAARAEDALSPRVVPQLLEPLQRAKRSRCATAEDPEEESP